MSLNCITPGAMLPNTIH